LKKHESALNKELLLYRRQHKNYLHELKEKRHTGPKSRGHQGKKQNS